MRPGRFRYRMELQKPLYSDGPTGKMLLSWQKVKDLFVSMEGIGSEQLSGEQMTSRILWSMQAHADAEIRPERRFVMNGRVFDIISVVPSRGNIDLFLDITAAESGS